MKKILYRVHELVTDERFGKPPDERTLEELLDSGFMLIDKPSGPSSHQVSGSVAKILNLKKAGHLGTLDTTAMGVLPVVLGKAVVGVHYLMKHDKEYIGTARFESPVNEAIIADAFRRFTGTIIQTPPIGAAVARRPRERQIYELILLELKDKKVRFKVSCEAGTYIRTLVEDIGKHLGKEAKLVELRRTKVGRHTMDDTISLENLEDLANQWKEKKKGKKLKSILHPIEDLTKDLKKVWMLDGAVDAVCSGAQLAVPGVAKLESGIVGGDEVCIFTLKDELVAFGASLMTSDEMVSNKKGTAVRISRVIMKRNTYPRIWKNWKKSK